VCRRELPVLEENLNKLTESYDVLALAHSEYGPTLDWVQNNLNGDLKIGFSTSELRDYFKIVGQPITIILDTNGEIIYRQFGEINLSNF
jgi:thioredoxin-related protein